MCLRRCSQLTIKGLNSTYWHSQTQKRGYFSLIKYIQKRCYSFYFVWTEHWFDYGYYTIGIHFRSTHKYNHSDEEIVPWWESFVKTIVHITTKVRRITFTTSLHKNEFAIVCSQKHWSPDWQLRFSMYSLFTPDKVLSNICFWVTVTSSDSLLSLPLISNEAW